jgi:hypothetical protein
MRTLVSTVSTLLVIGATAAIAAATPFFTQDPGTLPQGLWRVEEHSLYADYDTSVVDGGETPLVGGRDASSWTLNTRVRYGVRDDLTVFVDVPHVRKTLTDADGSKHTNEGLGDLFLLAKYRVYDNHQTKTRAAVVAATKLKTGEYRDLPPELALGTGQTNYIVGGLIQKQVGRNTYYASALHAFTGRRSDLNANPGDVTMLNLAGEFPIADSHLNAVTELNYSRQGKTYRDGARVDASGSRVLNAAAGLQYYPKAARFKKTVIEAEVQLPVSTSGYVSTLADPLYYVGAWVVF